MAAAAGSSAALPPTAGAPTGAPAVPPTNYNDSEEKARQFVESKNDVRQRLRVVTALRESIEIVHTHEYENFLKHFFPVFAAALRDGRPVFVDGDEQKIRFLLLEILHRFPANELLRPYVVDLARLAQHILSVDNEDNAITCMRIIFDVHKNYQHMLENEVQPFITFFATMYRHLPRTVAAAFKIAAPSQPPQQQPNQPGGAGDQKHHPQQPSSSSAAAGAGAHHQPSQAPPPLLPIPNPALLAQMPLVPPPNTHGSANGVAPMVGAPFYVPNAGSLPPLPPLPAIPVPAPLLPPPGPNGPQPTGSGLTGPPAPPLPAQNQPQRSSSSVQVPGSVAIGGQSAAGAGATLPLAALPPLPLLPTQSAAPNGAAGFASDQQRAQAAATAATTAHEQQLAAAAAAGLRVIPKSTESFKVLTECPLIVMLLFQLYPKFVEMNITALIPLMMKALEAGQGLATNAEAKKKPGVYADFIAAQVKTLSFLTYVLRGCADKMAPYVNQLAYAVLHLLTFCPPDAVASRKELLVATRHILATDFRKGFYKKIDHLLDEKTLIGASAPQFEVLRPLAYSTLADLVHHVRSELTAPQLSKVIYIFSRNIHDPSLPLSIQISSVRLVLNLVDHIYRDHDQTAQGRNLLVRILSTLVNKFETLKDALPRIIENWQQLRASKNAAESTAATAASLAAAAANSVALTGATSAASIAATAAATAAASAASAAALSSTRLSDSDEEVPPEESIKEYKTLIFTMVFGLKTVAWCILNYRGPPLVVHPPNVVPAKMQDDEVMIVARLLENGLKCFKIYTAPGVSSGATRGGAPEDLIKILNDVLEQFAGVFTTLDVRTFREVFSTQMEVLYSQILENNAMLIIPKNFLSHPDISKVFADMLLTFLTKKMPTEMSRSPTDGSSVTVMQQLFRMVFNSVTHFADNEAVLRPFLNVIVTESMKLAAEGKYPGNYFALLRGLFRSIGGGKFEALYKEFSPLLPDLLNGLMRMHSRGPIDVRDGCIELCLTVPARLSSLLPFIPLLMRAVVLALQSKEESVTKLGLRTLEFWVDNLNPEYLYPHMQAQSVLDGLMRALCALLRPLPSPFGAQTLNVLGKLGGRNRRFLIEEFKLKNRPHAEEGLTLHFQFAANKAYFALPMDRIISFSRKLLVKKLDPKSPLSATDAHAKHQSFILVKTCLLSMMNLTGAADLIAVFGGSTPAAAAAAADSILESKFDAKSRASAATGSAPGAAGPISASTNLVDITVGLPAYESIAPSENADELNAVRARVRNAATERTLSDLLHTCLIAATDDTFNKATPPTDESADSKSPVTCAAASVFLQHIIRQFALVYASARVGSGAAGVGTFRFNAAASEVHDVDTSVLIDVLLTALSDENRVHARTAEQSLALLIDTLVSVVGRSAAGMIPIINELLTRCMHRCYDERWEWRHAGAIGSSILATRLSREWVQANGGDLLRALFSCLRDVNEQVGARDAAFNTNEVTTTELVNTTLDSVLFSIAHAVSGEAAAAAAAAAAASAAATESTSSDGADGAHGEDSHSAGSSSSASAASSSSAAGASSSASASTSAAGDSKIAATPRSPVSPRSPNAMSDADPTAAVVSDDKTGSSAAVAVAADFLDQKTGAGKDDKEDASMDGKSDSKSAAATASATTPAAATAAAAAAAVGDSKMSDSKHSTALTVAGAGAALTEAGIKNLISVISIFAPELSSPISTVRVSARRLLELAEKWTARSVHSLLLPTAAKWYHTLLNAYPQLSLGQKIGCVSAFTYGLSIRPSALTSAQFTAVVKEAANDVTEDDRYAGSTSAVGRANRAALTVRLRVESVQLMTAALNSDEARKQNPKEFQELKNLCIRAFFRCLLSRSKEVAAAAKVGLKSVVEREKLPKDLLQQCLRPILLHLADPRKMTVLLLSALKRLLELLATHFNTSLGEKLIEHLKHLAEPETLIQRARAEQPAPAPAVDPITQKLLNPTLPPSGPAPVITKSIAEDQVNIAVAIIDLLHLAPAQPGKFIVPVIDQVIKLENSLPPWAPPAPGLAANGGPLPPINNSCGASSSPYRKPLARFLSADPKRAVDIFLQKLTSRSAGAIFQSIVRSSESAPIRAHLMTPAGVEQLLTAAYLNDRQSIHTGQTIRPESILQTKAANELSAAAHATAMANYQASVTAQAAAAAASNSATATSAAAAAAAANAAMPALPGATATPAAATTPAATTAPAAGAPAPPPPPPVGPPPVAPAQMQPPMTNVADVQLAGLTILHILISGQTAESRAFVTQKPVINALLDYWESPARHGRLRYEESMQPHCVGESKMIIECLINYCRANRNEPRILWRMLTAHNTRTLIDFTFLNDFYRTEVAYGYTNAQKKRVMEDFLVFFMEPVSGAPPQPPTQAQLQATPQAMQHYQLREQNYRAQQHNLNAIKVKALKLVIIPMLVATFKPKPAIAAAAAAAAATTDSTAVIASDAMTDSAASSSSAVSSTEAKKAPAAVDVPRTAGGSALTTPAGATEVIDESIVETIVRKLFGADQVLQYPEDLRIELLRLATLLIEYMHAELKPHRKELIKFAWNHLKTDQSMSKQWAYVNVCRFIDVYETPSKIVLQVYVALLRTVTVESRVLVRKSLDALMPSLPTKGVGQTEQRNKIPVWIKWTKKIIVEEGHMIPQFMHIWQLIIRHPDLFYAYRSQFVPQMVNSLSRLGLGQRPTENKTLAVDIAELVIAWDKRAAAEAAEFKANGGLTAAAVGASKDLKLDTGASAKESDMKLNSPPGSPTHSGSAGPNAASGSGVGGATPASADSKDDWASAVEPPNKKSRGNDAPADLSRSSSVAASTGPRSEEELFRPTTVVTSLVATFLARLGVQSAESGETAALSKRCFNLLREAEQVWRGAGSDVPLVYIDRLVNPPRHHDAPLPQVDVAIALHVAGLEVLDLLITYQPTSWLITNQTDVSKIVGHACKLSPHDPVRSSLCKFVEKFISAMYQPTTPTATPAAAATAAAAAPAAGAAAAGSSSAAAMTDTKSNALPAGSPTAASAIEEKSQAAAHTILQRLCNWAGEGLRSSLNTAVFAHVSMLHVLVRKCYRLFDIPLIASLLGVTKMLGHQHLTNQQARNIQPNAYIAHMRQTALLSEALVKAIRVLRERSSLLSKDDRKVFLALIHGLLERSNDVSVLHELSATICSSVLTSSNIPLLPGLPTNPIAWQLHPNERTAFLQKMCRFEKLDLLKPEAAAATPPAAPAVPAAPSAAAAAASSVSPPVVSTGDLLPGFLNTVLQLFYHNAKDRASWLSRLQRPFMIGLRVRDRELREKFVSLFQRYVGPTISDRLTYIFATQDWEPLQDSYWISPALDLLLTTIVDSEPLKSLQPVGRHAGATVPGAINTAAILATATSVDQLPSTVTEKQRADWLQANKQRLNKLAEIAARNSKPAVAVATAAATAAATAKPTTPAPAASGRSKRKIESIVDEKHSTPEKPKTDSAATPAAAAPAPMNAIASAADAKLDEEKHQLLTAHAAFLTAANATRASTLLSAMRNLVYTRPRFAHSVWITVVPIAWATLSGDERRAMSHSVSVLLAKDWHKRQAAERPNPVNTLLQGFETCYGLALKPELIKYLGRHFGVQHTARAMLEHSVLSLTAQQSEFPKEALPAYDALTQLCGSLNELDIYYGLWHHRAISEHTRSALGLEQNSLWNKAQDALYNAMMRAHAHNPSVSSVHEDVSVHCPRAEQALWEAEWVRCARHLNQWEVLSELSTRIAVPELQLESSWRLGHWSMLRELLQRSPDAPNTNQRLHALYLAIADRKHENREAERLVEYGVQSALREWQSLPPFVGAAHVPLLQQFQLLVELGESAAMLVDMAQAAGRNTIPSLRNSITTWRERLANQWEDIPVWGDLLTWRTHMFHIVSSAYANPAGMDHQQRHQFSRIHDTPWTIIKFAQMARKQGLPTVCLTALQKLGAFPSMETQDAFNKLREQVKTGLMMQSGNEVRQSLTVLSATNLDYFNPEHKAEVFRLKGEALQTLGYGDESNTAFSACLSVADNYGKGWLSWGAFCDRVFHMKRDAQWAEHSVVCYLQAMQHKSGRARQFMSRVFWLLTNESAAHSPLQSFAKFAPDLPSWTWLMWIPQLIQSLARPEAETAKILLKKLMHSHPQAVFYDVKMHYTDRRQQTAMAHDYAASHNDVLKRQQMVMQEEANAQFARQQAAAAAAKAKSANAMDVDSKADPAAGAPSAPPVVSAPGSALRVSAQASFVHLDDIYNTGRRAYPLLIGNIERNLQELNRPPFRGTEWEEDLLLQLEGVLIKTHKVINSRVAETKSSAAVDLDSKSEEGGSSAGVRDDPVPDASMSSLQSIYEKLFDVHINSPLQSMLGQKRLLQVVYGYREAFERDFAIPVVRTAVPALTRVPPPKPIYHTMPELTLTELIRRLQKWRAHLQYRTRDRAHTTLKLEKLSPILARYSPAGAGTLAGAGAASASSAAGTGTGSNNMSDMHIPGQYLLDSEPSAAGADSLISIARFETDVAVRQYLGAPTRRIAIRGDDGKVRYYYVHSTTAHIIRAEERFMQMYATFNRLMSKYKETRRRNITFHVPIALPIGVRSRLLETHDCDVSLSDIYEQSCAARSVDVDEPYAVYRDILSRVEPIVGAPTPDLHTAARLKVYNEVCSRVVPDYVLTRYVHRTLTSPDQVWAFKQNFAAQLALSSAIGYLFAVPERTPNKLIFSKQSGRVVLTDIYPVLTQYQTLDNVESIPFRLTRNMTSLLSPVVIDGAFAATLFAFNACLASNQFNEIVKNYLCVLMRDDITAQHVVKLAGTSPTANFHVTDAAQKAYERELGPVISACVAAVVRRTRTCSGGDVQPNRGRVPIPINSKVFTLIRMALSKQKLALMKPEWMPWL